MSYRVWRLSNKIQSQDVLMKTNNEAKPVTLLVRTKLDGCEVIRKIYNIFFFKQCIVELREWCTATGNCFSQNGIPAQLWRQYCYKK